VNAHRALVFVAVIAVLAALLVWRSRRHGIDPHADDRSVTAPSRAPSLSTGNATDGARAPDPLAAPAPEMIARDPEAAARLWRTRAKNVLRAKNTKEYGDEVARLLELPYDEAWGPLVEKAKTDARAALAATFIRSICTGESTRQGPRGRERPASTFYKDLPDAMKPFIDRIATVQTDEYEQRVARCKGIGDTADVMMMVIDTYMRPDNLEAQIYVAGENDDKRQAIADIRAILAKQDIARGRVLLGDLLMQSGDAAERTEGRAMLEQLAPDDPEVANRLAYCLQNGCGGSVPDLVAAHSWLEVSAGMGDEGGLSGIEHALADAGDNAGAWAWSVYALDLALDGCFEIFYPSHRHIASAAQTEAQRKAGLTPAEQNAGLAISYAIAGRWEKQAKERLSCD
jgi:hypothetical protein